MRTPGVGLLLICSAVQREGSRRRPESCDVEKLLARAGRARRSRHGVAMGPALRPGNETTFAFETELNQRQLARGRGLHPGQEQVGVSIPRGGLDWGDDRLHSLG